MARLRRFGPALVATATGLAILLAVIAAPNTAPGGGRGAAAPGGGRGAAALGIAEGAAPGTAGGAAPGIAGGAGYELGTVIGTAIGTLLLGVGGTYGVQRWRQAGSGHCAGRIDDLMGRLDNHASRLGALERDVAVVLAEVRGVQHDIEELRQATTRRIDRLLERFGGVR